MIMSLNDRFPSRRTCANIINGMNSVAKEKTKNTKKGVTDVIMSCSCNLLQKKLQKLQKKYGTLKKNHKKLIGLTVLLTEALEEFVKGETKSGINDILLTCSSIYPDLFESGNVNNQEINNLKIQPDGSAIQITDEMGKAFETAGESDREFYEGFMARPRIPRTPQV